MLHDRFTGAERSRNGRGTTLCHREEGIHDALSGLKRHAGREFTTIRASHTNCPLLHHRQIYTSAVRPFKNSHRFGNGVATGLYGNNLALHFGRNHNLVQNRGGLLHRTDNIAADDLITGVGGSGKLPLFLPIQSRHFHAARQVIATCFFHNGIQRTLNSVIDIFDQSGTQLDRKR